MIPTTTTKPTNYDNGHDGNPDRLSRNARLYSEQAEDRARALTPMTGGYDAYRDELHRRAQEEQIAKEMEQGL